MSLVVGRRRYLHLFTTSMQAIVDEEAILAKNLSLAPPPLSPSLASTRFKVGPHGTSARSARRASSGAGITMDVRTLCILQLRSGIKGMVETAWEGMVG